MLEALTLAVAKVDVPVRIRVGGSPRHHLDADLVSEVVVPGVRPVLPDAADVDPNLVRHTHQHLIHGLIHQLLAVHHPWEVPIRSLVVLLFADVF